MKIDTTKIEGYADMSAEDKLKALEAFEFDDSDDEKRKLKESLNKSNAEAKKYKDELRAKQSEEEKREAERKEADEKREAQLQELLKEKAIAEHKANFLKEGYTEELAETSAKALVDGDFKTMFANLGTFLTEKEKKVKEELLKKTPKPNKGGDGKPEITKEQFENMTFQERNKLYMENKELYESLKGEQDNG